MQFFLSEKLYKYIRIKGKTMHILPLSVKSDNSVFLSEKNAYLRAENYEFFTPIQAEPNVDSYVSYVPPSGTTNPEILAKAPKPDITIAGKKEKALFVIRLSENVLYKYDEQGKPVIAYRVASGAKRTPTDKGVRIISHVEKFPYKGAPRSSKRRRDPRAFGPYAIIVDKIDVKTGERSSTGEFVHGNKNPESIGQYASHGCIRMDNDVITQLATSEEVKRGRVIIIE